MKHLLLIAAIGCAIQAFAQESVKQIVEVRKFEYVWQRLSGDNRLVMLQDTMYQQQLKRSFVNAFETKWAVKLPNFNVDMNKVSMMRLDPKFNTSLKKADPDKWYLFVQFFDGSYGPSSSLRIKAKMKLVKGANDSIIFDRTVEFKVNKEDSPLGEVRLSRLPVYPGAFQAVCDTIAYRLVSEANKESTVSADLAFALDTSFVRSNKGIYQVTLYPERRTIVVNGANSFSLTNKNVAIEKTGKKKNVGGNAAGSIFTLLTNIDTEKRKSVLFRADHHYIEGTNEYNCYVNFKEVSSSERTRIRNDDGSVSTETSDAVTFNQITSDVIHLITLNGDTVSSFSIKFYGVREQYTKFWNGKDSNTIADLPLAWNNTPRTEMQMSGKIGEKVFTLITSDEGRIKKISVDGREVFRYHQNERVTAEIISDAAGERVKLFLLLSLLSGYYFNYR